MLEDELHISWLDKMRLLSGNVIVFKIWHSAKFQNVFLILNFRQKPLKIQNYEKMPNKNE